MSIVFSVHPDVDKQSTSLQIIESRDEHAARSVLQYRSALSLALVRQASLMVYRVSSPFFFKN